MKIYLKVSALSVMVSCGGIDNDKKESPSKEEQAPPNVCLYKGIVLASPSNPLAIPGSTLAYMCWEGYDIRRDGTKEYPASNLCDPKHPNPADSSHAFLKRLNSSSCPTNHISECDLGTYKIFMYEHEKIKADIEVFNDFCQNEKEKGS